MKTNLPIIIAVLALVLALSACTKPEVPEPMKAFTGIGDYQRWAASEGYRTGALRDEGVPGPNQDVYRTKPGMAGYDSGRIVIGDSRCCQLGIYSERAGLDGYAAFAVWGGHFADREPYIPTEEFFAEVEACFREQVKTWGGCEIFFFATVNDYDPDGPNDGNIAAAIACAERLASMEASVGGRTVVPSVTVIGIEGCGSSDWGWLDPETFNPGVAAYNDSLREALAESPILNGASYTTVPILTNDGADFIDDGLHYGDKTLETLARFVCSSES